MSLTCFSTFTFQGSVQPGMSDGTKNRHTRGHPQDTTDDSMNVPKLVFIKTALVLLIAHLKQEVLHRTIIVSQASSARLVLSCVCVCDAVPALRVAAQRGQRSRAHHDEGKYAQRSRFRYTEAD